jgi:hypothetical protein
MYGRSNHSKAPINVRTVMIVIDGARSGKRIFLKIFPSDAPSMRAASM